MNILIVKLGAIGDVVMASSMLEAARRMDMNTRITWLCGRGVETLVRAFVGVDQVVVADEKRLITGNLWEKIRELVVIWRQLLLKRFDLILVGHTDLRYLLLTITALAKERRCLRGRRLVRGRWHAAEYARLVYNDDGPDLPGVELAEVKISGSSNYMASLPKGKRLMIFPGGARNMLRDDALRRWPIAYYKELAEYAIRDGISVIMAGGVGDVWVRDHFKTVNVVDKIGDLNLPQVVSLCSACDLVVTHDSGPLHLAIVADTKILALFGPTNPMEKVPFDSKVNVLWGGERLMCRPCYDGRSYSHCASGRCLKDLTVEEVYQEVNNIFKKAVVIK